MSSALEICNRNLAKARQRDGIERAAAHAEIAQKDWVNLAVVFVNKYARTHPGRFMAEDIREAYLQEGGVAPPDERAWGAVMQHAAKLWYIRKVGYAPAASSNLSPKVQWESA